MLPADGMVVDVTVAAEARGVSVGGAGEAMRAGAGEFSGEPPRPTASLFADAQLGPSSSAGDEVREPGGLRSAAERWSDFHIALVSGVGGRVGGRVGEWAGWRVGGLVELWVSGVCGVMGWQRVAEL